MRRWIGFDRQRAFVTASIISSAGPVIVAASVGTTIPVFDNARPENSGCGIAAAKGNSVVINHSILSGNCTTGVEGHPGSQITVNGHIFGQKLQRCAEQNSVQLSNNNINFIAISGAMASFGNDYLSGNDSIDTARPHGATVQRFCPAVMDRRMTCGWAVHTLDRSFANY